MFNTFIYFEMSTKNAKSDAGFLVMEYNEGNFIPRIDWSSIDSPSIDWYHNKTSQLLCNITLDYDMLNCNDMSCNNSDNKLSVDNMYLCIIKALIPVVRTNGKFQPIDGRNDYVKTAHSDARQAFLLWQSNSKPRFGPISEIMNSSRARFKQCLRFCKSNEDRAQADALATKLLLNDNVCFWKEVRKMNRTDSNVLASTINAVTGENNIIRYGMTTITSCWTQMEILLINPMLNLSGMILYTHNQYFLGSLQ